MLVKVYGVARETEARYSPAECIGCNREEISGKPDSAGVQPEARKEQRAFLQSIRAGSGQ